MAYVYQKKGSPFWWMGFVNEAGVAAQESTKIRVGTKPAERRQSEKDANRKADDTERLALARREGREDPALVEGFTFGMLADKYWSEHASGLESSKSIASNLKHLRKHFGPRLLITIKDGDVKTYLNRMLKTPTEEIEGNHRSGAVLSPTTVAHLRKDLRRMFNFAIANGLLRKNPVTKESKVEPEEQPVRYLELEQVGLLLRYAPETYRNFLAVSLYTGLRKGEVIALRVANVDLAKMVIMVRNTHGRTGKTKGGKHRAVPIHPELVPYLKVELGRVRSEYLFPNPSGSRRSKHTKTERIIRQAAVKAGLVIGYDHKCRRKGCAFGKERRADNAVSRCPRCSMLLWVKGIPIDVKFKDARSTWATHAYEATGDFRFVQETLGHEDKRITEMYSAQRLAHLNRQASKLSFKISDNHLTPADPTTSAGATVHRLQQQSQDVPERAMRESNPRPLAPESGGPSWYGPTPTGTGQHQQALSTGAPGIEAPQATSTDTNRPSGSDNPLTKASGGES